MLIVFPLIICLMHEVRSIINVAINKTVTHCNSTRLSNKIVDGVVDINDAEILAIFCRARNSFVDIILGREYLIHYVIVYEGRAPSYLGRALHYFMVECDNDAGYTHICSTFPRHTIGPSPQGMRINCKVGRCSTIRIKSQINIGMALAEVEVYTLAGKDGENVNIYFGCFRNLVKQSEVPLRSVAWCLTHCAMRIFAVAGILNGSKCACGELIAEDASLPANECDQICQNKFCGGYNAYSVYIVNIQLPYLSGCRQLREEAILTADNMTVHMCLNTCYNFSFGAIKHLLQDGRECACMAENLDQYYDENVKCNVSCTGDEDTICGGDVHFSVFGASLPSREKKMINLFKCSGVWNHYGECMDNCTPGYIGPYCLEYEIKNCEIDNPCRDLVNTQCSITIDLQYACYCKSGFIINNSTQVCEDIDECEDEEACDIQSASACTNIIGSYKCVCLPGFFSVTDVVCMKNDSDKAEIKFYSIPNIYFVIPSIAILTILALNMAIKVYRSRNVDQLATLTFPSPDTPDI